MDDADIKAITDYLVHGIYPDGMDGPADRRILLRKSASFALDPSGRLVRSAKDGVTQTVVVDAREKQRIIRACHEDVTPRCGVTTHHNGVMSTVRMIGREYWWSRVVQDVRTYCRACDVCRITNKNRQISTNPYLSDPRLPSHDMEWVVFLRRFISRCFISVRDPYMHVHCSSSSDPHHTISLLGVNRC